MDRPSHGGTAKERDEVMNRIKIKSIIFFPNGNLMVFNDSGQQVPELQESWLLTMLIWLQQKGGEFEFDKVEIRLPDGSKAKPFRIESGWNWKISR